MYIQCKVTINLRDKSGARFGKQAVVCFQCRELRKTPQIAQTAELQNDSRIKNNQYNDLFFNTLQRAKKRSDVVWILSDIIFPT